MGKSGKNYYCPTKIGEGQFCRHIEWINQPSPQFQAPKPVASQPSDKFSIIVKKLDELTYKIDELRADLMNKDNDSTPINY